MSPISLYWRGGTGRHIRLKICRLVAWEFESPRQYHKRSKPRVSLKYILRTEDWPPFST